MNIALCEIQLYKAEVGHKKPIIVGTFILQYAKHRMLDPYYFFLIKLCGVHKFKEMEMHADSLYLALAEKELEECIRQKIKADWACGQKIAPMN